MRNVRGEPSDINWENLNIPKRERCWRKSIVVMVISLFLLISIVGTIVANI